MFSVEFGKIYRIFLISSVSELFSNSSRINFFLVVTYDTLSEIGKRKRKSVYRGAEVKSRLIVLRTCTSEVISYLYRNKLDFVEKGERGLQAEGPGWRPGGQVHPPWSRGASPPLVAVQ